MRTTKKEKLALFRKTVLVRTFEERAGELFKQNLIPGFIHLSIGEEASSGGTCSVLRPDDYLTSTHRGHGHMIAKGADPRFMLAELHGKASGGGGLSAAAQHSQCLESWFVHTPGLKVVAPSEPPDVKGLIKSAIREDDPVVFFQHKKLFAQKGPVPEGEYLIPLGKAAIKREGTASKSRGFKVRRSTTSGSALWSCALPRGWPIPSPKWRAWD